MADKITVSDLTQLSANESGAVATINANFAALEEAIDNTLSRDGSTPNEMEADLDMNGNSIMNLPAATSATEPVRKAEFDAAAAYGVSSPIPSVTDFGATLNGVTDDTASVTAAEAVGRHYVPAGTVLTTIAQASLRGPFWGDGQIKTSDNNKRGKYFAAIAAAPSSEGTHTSVLTAFNGDIRKVQFAVEHRITGTATLGQPTTGYKYTPEAYPHYTYLFNSSGYNHEVATNVGRTNAVAYHVRVSNFGQGDCTAFNANGFVTGTRSGFTSFLSNPAVSLFSGGVTAGSNYVFLNPVEINCTDGGFDVTSIGAVFNIWRTNGTGANDCVAHGIRVQSKDSAAIDSAYFAVGKTEIVFDATGVAGVGGNLSAFVMGGDQKFHYGATPDPSAFQRSPTLNNHYMSYVTSRSALSFFVNNNRTLEIGDNKLGFFGATPVLQQSIGAALSTGGAETNTNLATRINQIRTALINLGFAV